MTVFIRIYKIDNICSYYFILLRLTMRSLFCDVTLSNTCSIIIQEYVFTWNCNFTVNFLIFAFSFYMLQKKKKFRCQLLQFFKCQFKNFYCEKKWEWWVDRYQNEHQRKQRWQRLPEDFLISKLLMLLCQTANLQSWK